jgi:hypothetical protein
VNISDGNTTVELDRSDALDGSAAAYLEGPGTSLRCRRRASVIGRVATTPAGTWLSPFASQFWRLPTFGGK